MSEKCPKCGMTGKTINCPDEMLGHIIDDTECLRRQLQAMTAERDARQMECDSLKRRIGELESYTAGLAQGSDTLRAEADRDLCDQERRGAINALAKAEAERNKFATELDELQCGIASALGWPNDGIPFVESVRALKIRLAKAEGVVATMGKALSEIHKLGIEWTEREPLEIVCHGGVGHAAPVGEIIQLAAHALDASAATKGVQRG